MRRENWIAQIIDALADLYEKTGAIGLVVLAVVLIIVALAFAIFFILTRHTGTIAGVATEWVKMHNIQNVILADIAKSNTEISATNAGILSKIEDVHTRVHKLPSDSCKAKSQEEIKTAVKEAIREEFGKPVEKVQQSG